MYRFSYENILYNVERIYSLIIKNKVDWPDMVAQPLIEHLRGRCR